MAKNHLRIDPSRTALLRRAFSAQMQKRFDRLRRAVWRYIITHDSLGLKKPTANANNFQFTTDDKKLDQFNKWLKSQIDQGILEVNPQTGDPLGLNPWLYTYVDSAYKKGVVRAYTEAHQAELGHEQPYYEGTRAQFLESSFAAPERISKLRLLGTRTFEDLKGVTAQMSSQMSRVLADGMAHGKGPMQIAKTLSNTITGVPIRRAKVIARTETIHAHAEGQLDGLMDLGVEEVGVEAEFTDSDDDAVCPECAALNGKVFTIKEARGVIPVHPLCRCSWSPVFSDSRKKKGFAKV